MNHLRSAERFAKLMDDEFKVLGFGFGLDNIIGLIPGLGDLITAFFSFYLLWIGYQMNIPTGKMLQMIMNIVLDTGIGLIPLVGDIGDLLFKANVRNLKILQEFSGRRVLEPLSVEI